MARQLTRELGSDPEPEQIAAALGVTVERVNELRRWSQDTVSLDTPVGDDGGRGGGECFGGGLDIVGVYELETAHPHHVLGRSTEELLEGRAGVGHAGVRVEHHHAVMAVLHESAEPFFALA